MFETRVLLQIRNMGSIYIMSLAFVGVVTIGARKIKKGVMLRHSKHADKGLNRHAFTFCISGNTLAYTHRTPFESLRVTPIFDIDKKNHLPNTCSVVTNKQDIDLLGNFKLLTQHLAWGLVGDNTNKGVYDKKNYSDGF
nr:hypothetical protein [Mucilaginibacter sp. X4EP1]MCS3816228.1 hypothetical protein [Mucilaginibacter sp. X4EP1]